MSKYQVGRYKAELTECAIRKETIKDKDTGQDVEREYLEFKAKLLVHIDKATKAETAVPDGVFCPASRRYLTGGNIDPAGKGFEFTMNWLKGLAGEENLDDALTCFYDDSLVGRQVLLQAIPNEGNDKFPIKFEPVTGEYKPKDRAPTIDRAAGRKLANILGIQGKRTSKPVETAPQETVAAGSIAPDPFI